jgi:hypothetical protein
VAVLARGCLVSESIAQRRGAVLSLAIAAAAALLLLVLLVRMATEAGGTNAYALIAESFLTGTPWASTCYGADCGFKDGHHYIVFPPLPGVIAMPLVALFGVATAGFLPIGTLAAAIGLLIWSRIFTRLGLDPRLRAWLLVAVAFASPLTYVTLRTEGLWFFAQAIAFPLVALAIDSALAGRLVLAGSAIAAAFLCRQMSLAYAPLLLLLTLDPQDRLLHIERERVVRALRLGLPILAGLAAYFLYNAWRFGDPFETGYRYIQFDEGSLLRGRVDQYGLWNAAYVPFNAIYLLLQGFHVEFAPPDRLSLAGLDPAGTSILSASPWLLFLFFTPVRRHTVLCGLIIVALATLLLFYHSNGFSQYNTQRYALDWLPAALLMLAAALRPDHLPVLRLLIGWGVVLNAATVAILALTRGA